MPDGRPAGPPGQLLQRLQPAGRGDRGAWKPDQYSNPNGPASYCRTTRTRSLGRHRGKVTTSSPVSGTGGTITGAGRCLKEVSGGRVQVIGADPEGRCTRANRPAYLVEGVGEDFWPGRL